MDKSKDEDDQECIICIEGKRGLMCIDICKMTNTCPMWKKNKNLLISIIFQLLR